MNILKYEAIAYGSVAGELVLAEARKSWPLFLKSLRNFFQDPAEKMKWVRAPGYSRGWQLEDVAEVAERLLTDAVWSLGVSRCIERAADKTLYLHGLSYRCDSLYAILAPRPELVVSVASNGAIATREFVLLDDYLDGCVLTVCHTQF